MTKEESLELFDLPADASDEQIIEKFREMYSDYMLRLTNAPSPNLKKIYNQNIEKLEKAFKILCPDAEADSTQFLPTDKPMLDTVTPNVNINISNKIDTMPQQKKSDETKKKKSGISIPILLGLISFLFFAVGLSFFIMYLKGKDEITLFKDQIKIMESRISSLQQDSVSIYYKCTPFLKNGKLKLVNKYSVTIYLQWVSVLYYDESLNKYNEVRYNSNLELKPNESKILEKYDSNVEWDGKVIYFNLRMTTDRMPDGTQQAGYFGGLWHDVNSNGEFLIMP